MTDGTVSVQKLFLIDNWPGPAPRGIAPTDGFCGTTHNVSTAAYRVGTKLSVYNTDTTYGIVGESILMYGYVASIGTGQPILNQHVCTVLNTSCTYGLTNHTTNVGNSTGLIAVALSSMTTGRYGWFWVGGVAPANSSLIGNTTLCTTLGTVDVAVGANIIGAMGATTTTYGGLGLSALATTALPCAQAFTADT